MPYGYESENPNRTRENFNPREDYNPRAPQMPQMPNNNPRRRLMSSMGGFAPPGQMLGQMPRGGFLPPNMPPPMPQMPPIGLAPPQFPGGGGMGLGPFNPYRMR